ncbi:threonine aldolase family protein [Streptomyces sp. NPDC057794]|uniref:threonine aldolase family protein n=1 Tax=Streptomyces sp. NPDC057794 TaxID=3346251 RepID=UPI0036999BCE
MKQLPGTVPGGAGDTAGIRRSLSLHAPLRRTPHRLLRAMLDALPEDGLPEDPVAELERRMCALLGTEAALLFPTGTMAQQVALRIHADRRGRRAFAAHPQTHLEVWEEQGYAVVHGLRFRPVGDRHRLLETADLAGVAEPLAALLLELPQRDVGGRLPAWDDLLAQVSWARGHGAAVHLDGARLWEAQPFYGRPHAEIAALFDTVYVSLYKGLEGIRGAILASDARTVGEAAVWRQRLGGALDDAWPLAAAALVGLDTVAPRMSAFRDHAVAIAAALREDGAVHVVPDPPQTPLFHVHVPAGPEATEAAAREILREHGVQLYLRLRTAPHDGQCSFEVCVGENAMEFTPDEVAALLRELVHRARGTYPLQL